MQKSALVPGRGQKEKPNLFEKLFSRKERPPDTPRSLLERRERWLQASAYLILMLSSVAFLLVTFPFPEDARFALWQIGSEQGTAALLALLILFFSFSARERSQINRQRWELSGGADRSSGAEPDGFVITGDIDPVTGLCTRKAAEEHLGKDLARAKRRNQPVSILMLNLDDWPQLSRRVGGPAGNQVLQEFAQKLRQATRGSDLPVRMGIDEFAVVLPECAANSVQRVLDRLRPVTVNLAGEKLTATYSTTWVDYQAGEAPGQLLGRAQQMLKLYRTAG